MGLGLCLGALMLGIAAAQIISLVAVKQEGKIVPEVAPPAATVDFELAFNPWLDTGDADLVRRLYQQEFSKEDPDIDWFGDHETCDGGVVANTSTQATLDRVNYYRAMAGVPAEVVENPEYSEKAQTGAMMMSSEGELSHNPPKSFECFSDEGFEAASNSNLYLGRTGPSAVDGYMQDPGEDNTDVGHRNTLLHPPTEEMGVGNVEKGSGKDSANLIWVFDENVFETDTDVREPEGFIAWPARGYVPRELVFPRWSISRHNADFDAAEVSMVDADGVNVPLRVVAVLSDSSKVPNPILVWEPELNLADTEAWFTVSITGVKVGGETKDYSYDVKVLESQ